MICFFNNAISNKYVNKIIKLGRLWGIQKNTEAVGKWDPKKEELEKKGCKSLIFQADLTRADEIKKLFDFILDNYGHLDVLVNNAGTNIPEHFIKVQKKIRE